MKPLPHGRGSVQDSAHVFKRRIRRRMPRSQTSCSGSGSESENLFSSGSILLVLSDSTQKKFIIITRFNHRRPAKSAAGSRNQPQISRGASSTPRCGLCLISAWVRPKNLRRGSYDTGPSPPRFRFSAASSASSCSMRRFTSRDHSGSRWTATICRLASMMSVAG